MPFVDILDLRRDLTVDAKDAFLQFVEFALVAVNTVAFVLRVL